MCLKGQSKNTTACHSIHGADVHAAVSVVLGGDRRVMFCGGTGMVGIACGLGMWQKKYTKGATHLFVILSRKQHNVKSLYKSTCLTISTKLVLPWITKYTGEKQLYYTGEQEAICGHCTQQEQETTRSKGHRY